MGFKSCACASCSNGSSNSPWMQRTGRPRKAALNTGAHAKPLTLKSSATTTTVDEFGFGNFGFGLAGMPPPPTPPPPPPPPPSSSQSLAQTNVLQQTTVDVEAETAARVERAGGAGGRPLVQMVGEAVLGYEQETF
eukprot:COSAG05_NODE_334_length_11233_cov_697.826477_1_plen_136_part_00